MRVCVRRTVRVCMHVCEILISQILQYNTCIIIIYYIKESLFNYIYICVCVCVCIW